MAVTATDIYVRSGNAGAFTEVEYVKGGWITLPSASDMIALSHTRVGEGQIVYVQHENKLYKGSFFEAFVTPGYSGVSNSQSFAEFSWPGSGGGGDADIGTLNSFSASVATFTSSIQTQVDGLQDVTGSYAVTASNTFTDDQTIDGLLILTTQSATPTFVSGGLYLDASYNLYIGGS